MSKEAGLELKKARISAKLPVVAVAQRCYTSERTIARWEDGECDSPDDVDRYAEAVGDPGLWDRWMRLTYDSYGRRFPEEGVNRELALAIVDSRHQMEDVLALTDKVERDAMDGRIDDPELRDRYRKEALEAFTALKNVLERLE